MHNGRVTTLPRTAPAPEAACDGPASAGLSGACCSPLTGGALDGGEADRLARLLKALADPTRLRLVSLIAARENREACVCDLTEPVNLGQPTVSHHLKILVDAGILHREKRGVWAYFSLVPGALEQIGSIFRG